MLKRLMSGQGETRGAKCLLYVMFSIVAFGLPGLVGSTLKELGVSADREGIEKLLTDLADQSQDSERRCRELLKGLESDSFAEREEATAKLANLRGLDRAALERIKNDVPPEVAMRIQQVLKLSKPERQDDIIGLALDAIVDNQLKGLSQSLIRALKSGSAHKAGGAFWKRATEAARVSALPEDIELLKTSLTSEIDLIRIVAVEGIIGAAGEKGGDLLLPAIDDNNHLVKWAVAKQLARCGKRECLKPLAELLNSDDFGVRWRSLDELRRISGKEFGYFAADEAKERAGAAARWKNWAETEGQTADLKF